MEGSFPSEFLLLGVVNHLCVAINFTLVQKNLDDYYNTLSFISLVGMYALCGDNDDTIVLAVGRIVYKTGSSDKLTEQEVMNCWGQPRFCLVDNTTMFVMTIIVITMKMMMSESLQRQESDIGKKWSELTQGMFCQYQYG